MSLIKNEAEEVAVECCKSLVLLALNSNTVQQQLDDLSPYKVPFAVDMNEDESMNQKEQITWQELKNEMNNNWDKKKQVLQDTEFHDFLEYVISETLFNITAEMLENFEMDNPDTISTTNDIQTL